MDGVATIGPGFAAGVLPVLDCCDPAVRLVADALSMLGCCETFVLLTVGLVVIIEGSWAEALEVVDMVEIVLGVEGVFNEAEIVVCMVAVAGVVTAGRESGDTPSFCAASSRWSHWTMTPTPEPAGRGSAKHC